MTSAGLHELKEWCTNNKLTQDQYTTLATDMEFDSLEGLALVSESDIEDIAAGLGLKFGKKSKFKKALITLARNFAANEESKDDESNHHNNNSNNSNNNGSQQPAYRGPKKKVSLLFVGETGVGKSTLLLSLKDFLNGVAYAQVRHTPKTSASGASQTQDTKQYPLSSNEWAVNIIDTPGIGDTQGFQTDGKHMGNIIDFVGNFGDFNACCILIKRGTTRLTSRMKYIVNELRSNMPRDMQDNFIVIMTRSDVPVPDTDTKNVIKGLHLPIGNIIPVNNGAYEELDLSDYPAGSPTRKIVQQRQQQDYTSNHQWLQMLLETAHAMTPYQGQKMRALKVKRDKLKEDVGLLMLVINNSFTIERKINEQLRAFEAAKNAEQLNQAWNASKQQPTFSYTKINGKITTHCNSCAKSCHIGCGLSYGDDLTGCCCSGSNAMCNQCGHSMANHCHLGWKSNVSYTTIQCENDQMKLKWNDAKQQQQQIEARKRNLIAQKTALEQKRRRGTLSIQRKYAELKQIAIIGYNEDFETYMKECQKAVAKDISLTLKEKQKKMSIFDDALAKFRVFKNAISGAVTSAMT